MRPITLKLVLFFLLSLGLISALALFLEYCGLDFLNNYWVLTLVQCCGILLLVQGKDTQAKQAPNQIQPIVPEAEPNWGIKLFDVTLVDDAEFKQHFAVTQRWCQQHPGGAKLLWPESLRPVVDIYTLSFAEIERLNRIKALEIAEDVVELPTEAAGRVVVLYPMVSLNDAMMSGVANGMIDDEDLPPWATWFYFAEESGDGDGAALYAWIPQAFIADIDRAIDNDAYGCLRWMGDDRRIRFWMEADAK